MRKASEGFFKTFFEIFGGFKHNIVLEGISLKDFIKCYKVFRKKPYNEAWTRKKMRAEYKVLFSQGHVCGYYLDNKCVGLVTFYPMIPGEHPVPYSTNQKAMYLSDLAVRPAYRRRGIGSKLMRYALETSKKEGFDIVYMRTLPIGQSMSYNLAISTGFKLMENVLQDVTMERNAEERNEVDSRIFLDVDLHNWP